MKNIFKTLMVAGLVVVLCSAAGAKTLTNEAGTVYTVALMGEMTGSAEAQKATVYANRVGQQGLLVSHYDTTLGATGSISLVGCTVPMGAIFLENSVVELTTAFATADTNVIVAITVGGVTVTACNTNTSFATAGILASELDGTAQTTSAAAPVIAITGATLTAGKLNLYLPYIQGTAWK